MKIESFTIAPGSDVSLAALNASDTGGYGHKREARKKLQHDIEELSDLQDKLSAQAGHAVLIVLQGMDTAGKDGAIKHVLSGVNPAGVDVYSFKQPSVLERSHDYLWRAVQALPARGRIAIFNRSYYEDVLVTRVHPGLLGADEVRADAGGSAFWTARFDDINDFERYLTRNGTTILKFFLHISKAQQKKRLLARLNDPAKQWKFSLSDLRERPYWDAYVEAYEQMLSATSTQTAPWYVIPSDRKWYARLAIASVIVERIRALDPAYPPLSAEMSEEIVRARTALESEPA